ncbi:MAG TPA: PQQ-dependent sugar dehydrogenase [Chitinophagaceae bacterium]|nr:PQQ-dependent sugar dehydrogenase [Chitinophagaceae bacterium]
MHRKATPYLNYPVIILLTLVLSAGTGHAQPNLIYTPVITGLNQPIDIVNAGDGTNRLFVVQKEGVIRIYSQAYAYIGDLVTVSGISSGGERGLLSLAFHPDYETNRFFYVYYTTTTGSSPNTTTFINIARYQTRASNPNIADDTSRKVLLSIAKPTGDNFTNHNGGRLQFGSDGMLYFATGDGGSGGDPFNNAQNGNSLLGKMIRLRVNTGDSAYIAPYYTIPTDNPYTDDPSVRDEIFALGLRNPFRWSFDRLTYDMWIGDVGQDAREEINYLAAGIPPSANFGWRCYEGSVAYNTAGCGPQNSYIAPVYDYPNPVPGAAAVTGGQVYRGSLYPALYGYYIAADFYSGNTYKIRPNGGGWWVSSQTLATGIAAFGEAENGELYAVSLNAGSVSTVTTNTQLPLRLVNFNAIRKNNHIEVSWRTTYEIDLKNFQVEYSFDGRNYQLAQAVAASNSLNGSSYSVQHHIANTGVIYYRLRINNADGTAEYSPVVTTSWDKQLAGAFVPGIVRGNRLRLTIYEPFTSMRVLTPSGQTMFVRNITGMIGFNEILIPQLPQGTYIVQLVGNARQFSGRIVVSRE